MITRRGFAGAAGGIIGGGFMVSATAAEANTMVESETFQQIMDTKVLRVPAFAANQPHMWKDLEGNWRGWLYEVSKILASDLGAELEVLETTWGNSLIDLQQNKIDLIIGTTPTPERLRAVDISVPMYKTRLAITARPDLVVETWEDLNKPEIKISCDVGTVHEHMARRLCPKAEIVALKTIEEAALAVRSRRADAHCVFWTSSKRSVMNDPAIGTTIVPTPTFFSSSSMGIRRERDKTWRDFVNGWIDYARGAGIIQVAYLDALETIGIERGDASTGIEF